MSSIEPCGSDCQDYSADLKTKVMADRQRATVMYFIDRLALRAGNEKGEDEADTVGCCSLRCEHVTLLPPDQLVFDFLGQDSIRYYNQVSVDEQVYKDIQIFKEGKEDDDRLFDRVQTSGLNKHLASYMKGLTAKAFRTYNASITFQQQLDQGTPESGTVQKKLNAYKIGTRHVIDIEVRVLCLSKRMSRPNSDLTNPGVSLATPTLNKALGPLRDNIIKDFNIDAITPLQSPAPTPSNLATTTVPETKLSSSDSDELSSSLEKHLCITDPKGTIRSRVGDMLFEYTAGPFSQNNNVVGAAIT
ncbi:DNA topoisomerase 1 [Grifola frondosa]|uniref:DNA topoisomerase n=1 Tax=Grifola frondosa TaxID=5627 RepID=A0A1C7LRH2_GRIFR|nr:DNA topoisomerase 1 [Grifola frondosa]